MKSLSSSIIVLAGVVLFSFGNTAGHYEWPVRWVGMLMIAVGVFGWVMSTLCDDSK